MIDHRLDTAAVVALEALRFVKFPEGWTWSVLIEHDQVEVQVHKDGRTFSSSFRLRGAYLPPSAMLEIITHKVQHRVNEPVEPA